MPRERLDCVGLDDPIEHAALVAASVTPLLRRGMADLIIVQGDTSSALGGADAAVDLGLPVAHVEAGLRSFDRAMPWPEEDNRIAIDAMSDLLFAPTEGAATNLRHEGVAGEIHVTGNTGIDALQATLATLPPAVPRRRDAGAPLELLVTCHRRENWGEGLEAIAAAVNELAREGSARSEVILHPNPRIADLMHRMFAGQPGIRLSLPAIHRTMVVAMRAADLILSDSGGVQEEAPALGVPLLVLRERTERPEAVASGNAILVGASTARILAEVRRLAADRSLLERMALPAFPFGDGHAAPRIAGHIRQWLIERDRPALDRRRA